MITWLSEKYRDDDILINLDNVAYFRQNWNGKTMVCFVGGTISEIELETPLEIVRQMIEELEKKHG